MSAVWVLASLILAWFAYRALRRRWLFSKYHDKLIVNRIMRRTIWQGMTIEQLTDCLGRPSAIDHEQLKSKSKQRWKYRPFGKSRYRQWVMIEDGVVTGWKN
jgi:hypothetical protein